MTDFASHTHTRFVIVTKLTSLRIYELTRKDNN